MSSFPRNACQALTESGSVLPTTHYPLPTPTTDTHGFIRRGNEWIDAALERMSLDGLPAGSGRLGFVERRLLALCRELHQINQERAGRDDFILPVRAAAKAIGLTERDTMRVHRLLTCVFTAQGWLEVIHRGEGRHGSPANVYRFIAYDHRMPDGEPCA